MTRAGNDLDQIADGLEARAHWLGDLAHFGTLDDPIPMTALSPTGDQGLALADLFGDSLGLLRGDGFRDSDAPESAIGGASGVYGGVTIQFMDTNCNDTTNAALIDFRLKSIQDSALTHR